jgi:hypothetical protein
MITGSYCEGQVVEEAVVNDDSDTCHEDQRKMLEAAHAIFLGYAKRGVGQYVDIVEKDLRNSEIYRIFVQGPDMIIQWIKYVQAYDPSIEFLFEDRQFVFSLNKESVKKEKNVSDSEVSDDVDLKAKKKLPLILVVVIAALSVMVALVSVSVFGNEKKYSAVEKNSAKPEMSAAPVKAEMSAAPVKIDSVRIVKATDVNGLVEQEYFSDALVAIDSVHIPGGSAKMVKSKILSLVKIKADSVGKEILSLVDQGKFKEAFLLEKQFDKDVFALSSGRWSSKHLRSYIMTAWVNFYKKEKEEPEAMRIVSNDVAVLLDNSGHFVGKKSNGHYYLDYDQARRKK